MTIRIGRIEISGDRWPWQKRSSVGILDRTNKAGDRYGWKPSGGMGRFGGGWNFKLGIAASRGCFIADLIFGSVQIEKRRCCLECGGVIWKGERHGNWGNPPSKGGHPAYMCHEACAAHPVVVQEPAPKGPFGDGRDCNYCGIDDCPSCKGVPF